MSNSSQIISLIGMSGAGKSYWSSELASAGFTLYSCDELIAKRIGERLALKKGAIAGLAGWMGFPFDPGYAEREKRYLDLEIEVLTEILTGIEKTLAGGLRVKAVVDTTGSVVYTGRAVLDRLKKLTAVVYLSLAPETRKGMLESYLIKPRPLLWHGMFEQRPGESQREALARCYPALVEERERLYRGLCDAEIPHTIHRMPGLSAGQFVDEIAARMPGDKL